MSMRKDTRSYNQPADLRCSKVILSRDYMDTVKRHHWMRKTGSCVVVSALVLMVLGVVLIVALQSPSVNHTLMQKMKLMRTDDGKGLPMDYHHMTGIFPFDFTLHGLKVIDPTGRSVAIGSAKIVAKMSAIMYGDVVIDRLTLSDSTSIGGGGFIEDNTLYTEKEQASSIHRAKKLAAGKAWPFLPYGIGVNHFELINLTNPGLSHGNAPISITGSINVHPMGGSFSLDLKVLSEDRALDVDLSVDGDKITRRVRVTGEARNNSLTCFGCEAVSCEWPVSVDTVFATETEVFSLATRSDIKFTIDGPWGGLLQLAFPSKHWTGQTDLVEGVISAASRHHRPLVSRAMVVFHVTNTSTMVLDEARLTSSLFHQQDSSVTLQAEFPVHPESLSQLLDELTVVLPRQKMMLPLPLNTIDVEAVVRCSSSGKWLLAKYDTTGSYIQWSVASGVEWSRANGTVAFHDITVDAFMGHMAGTASFGYSKEGVSGECTLIDVEHDLVSTLSIRPYVDQLGVPSHHLLIDMRETAVTLADYLVLGNISVEASVLGLPHTPYGSMSISMGSANYDNGAFVMNDMSVSASRAEDATPSTPWELTASSDKDLRTSVTLYLVGNGESEFRGSLSPFDAKIYGEHRLWTTKPSELHFDYRRQEFSLHALFHANERLPERNSLDVTIETDHYKLIINDESYLLDPLFLRQKSMKSSGLLQGYIQVDRIGAAEAGSAATAGSLSLGALDMCWNDGHIARDTAEGDEDEVIASSIHGCIQGTPEDGWSIRDPAATAWVENPRMGNIELRGNITAFRREGELRKLVIPASLEIQMRNNNDKHNTDSTSWVDAGWMHSEFEFALNL